MTVGFGLALAQAAARGGKMTPWPKQSREDDGSQMSCFWATIQPVMAPMASLNCNPELKRNTPPLLCIQNKYAAKMVNHNQLANHPNQYFAQIQCHRTQSS